MPKQPSSHGASSDSRRRRSLGLAAAGRTAPPPCVHVGHEHVVVERLLHEVEGPGLQAAHGHGHVAVPRDHDHGRRRRAGARSSARSCSPSMPGIFTSVTTQAASPRPGQASAASADANASTAKPRRRSICAEGVPGRPRRRPPRHQPGGLAVGALLAALPAPSPPRVGRGAGRRTVKVAPRPGTPSASIVPPWSCHDRARDGQPQPPWPLSLVVKNGWNSLRAVLRREARARVGHLDHDGQGRARPRRERTESRRTAAALHGLAGVGEQVEEHLGQARCGRRARRAGRRPARAVTSTSREPHLRHAGSPRLSRTTLLTSTRRLCGRPGA